jgi:VCBS repeat protein/FG-GAP repeat protein
VKLEITMKAGVRRIAFLISAAMVCFLASTGRHSQGSWDAHANEANPASDDSISLPYDLEAGTRPVALAVGDFNADGLKDLAVANAGSANVSILLGRGDGTFLPHVDYSVGGVNSAIAVGDFNNDTKQDLAVTDDSPIPYPGSVSILVGAGDGTFTLGLVLPSPWSRAVAVSDFDGDGNQDLAVARTQASSPMIMYGYGDGTFSVKFPFYISLSVKSPTSVAIGYFNRDDIPDLAVAFVGSPAEPSLTGIYMGLGDRGAFPGSGGFDSPVPYRTGFGLGISPSVVIGDFDGDGFSDLAVTGINSYYGYGNLSFLQGLGDGTFKESAGLYVGDSPLSAVVADFDADGRQDLATANSGSGDVTVLLNLGPEYSDSPFHSFFREAPLVVGGAPTSILAADFDADGRPDLAVANGNVVSIASNRAIPQDHPPVAIPRIDSQGADSFSVECTSPKGAEITLGGAASFDPDSTPGTNDDIVSFEWFEAGDIDYGPPYYSDVPIGSGETLDLPMSFGYHLVHLKVTDRSGVSSTAGKSFLVDDTTPPRMSLSLSPNILWPPNHQLVDIVGLISAQDTCGDTTVTLEEVTSSESDDAPGTGDGNTSGDVQGVDLGTPDIAFSLRSERDSHGPGRVYRVTYRATDSAGGLPNSCGRGNSTTQAATVIVPISMSKP